MRFHLVVIAIAVMVLANAKDVRAVQQQKAALAGWPGVFPVMPSYEIAFQPPILGAAAAKTTYHQKAEYSWTGGAIRRFTIFIGRDPAFKQIYGEESVKKRGEPAAQRVEVGKYAAWLWNLDRPRDKKDGAQTRLVVLLAEDRIVMIEAGGDETADTAQTLAGKLDLKKINEALDNPPDSSSRRTVEAFRRLRLGMSYAEVNTWVGPAAKDIGSGIHIMTYTLDDGSQVLLGFPDFNKLIYVKHRGNDGKTTDLVK